MPLSLPLKLAGAPGSPYTRKMRGLLRYRRIAHVIIDMYGPEQKELPRARPPLLPTFYLPDESGEIAAVTDSTPLIRRFEKEWPDRSVIPTDPVLAFLDELLEDYADEWLTKCMFHFRWYHEADATKARRILPRHLDKVRLAKIYARRGQIMFEMGQYDRSNRYLGWAKKLLSGTNDHEELAIIEMELGMPWSWPPSDL